MFRPDHLGLIGFVLIFLLSFAFRGLDRPSSDVVERDQFERRPSILHQSERRRPVPKIPTDVLPPISKNDPTFTLGVSRKGNSTGTAFSIGEGEWMTARHVLEGCAKYGILVGRKRVEKGFDLTINPFHDLAVFHTKRKTQPLGFESQNLKIGQDAFHFGYPQGKPADIHSKLLGRMMVKPNRGKRRREPLLAWAEVKRIPNFSGSIGGMSGGPVLDKDGDIIGVSVIEARRRGRIFTSAPIGMEDMLYRAGKQGLSSSGKTIKSVITPVRFPATGSSLRSKLTVAKVVCWVS